MNLKKQLLWAFAFAGLAASLPAMGKKPEPLQPDWIQKPRVLDWKKEAPVYEPISWLQESAADSGPGLKLMQALGKKLPGRTLPAEGYLIETGPAGTVVVYKDAAAKVWAGQTLLALSSTAQVSSVKIADWPELSIRAFHLIPYTPKALPGVKRLVKEYLVPLRINTFIFEIGYAFDFKSDPKVREKVYFTRAEIRDFVEFCRALGVKVIPEVNSIGHQSWKLETIGGLLTAHPELEEIPDASTPEADLESPQFYCKSWCPLHPDLHKILFPLYDELIEAFDSKAFHVGTDEIFVLGSKKCPRCNGRVKSELYAQALGDVHAHLKSKGQEVLIWGDRLLDSAQTGYSRWDASDQGTHRASALLPKDILVCDWHYAFRDEYPSLKILSEQGYRVLPTTYADPRAAAQFVKKAAERKDPNMAGAVASVWFGGLQAAAAVFPDVEEYRRIDSHSGAMLPKDKMRKVQPNEIKIMKAAAATLKSAWNPESMETKLSWPKYSWGGPWGVPGRILAADFNLGGEGKGYHDSDKLNEGGHYRDEGADVAATTDKGEESLRIGWNAEGEWQAYDLNVKSAGKYIFALRAGSPSGGGQAAIEIHGKQLALFEIPKTGGWDEWVSFNSAPIELSAGKQRLVVKVIKSGYDWTSLEIMPAQP